MTDSDDILRDLECPHVDAAPVIWECRCDCGRTVIVCRACLLNDKILACGTCGRVEATDRTDGSLATTREFVKLERELSRATAEHDQLKAESDELESRLRERDEP